MTSDINKTCETCGGDGIVTLSGNPPQSVPCWQCAGEGKHVISTLDSDRIESALLVIVQKLNEILAILSPGE